MTQEEKKRKQCEATARWRLKNLDKVRAYSKYYRSRPGHKERHRLAAAEWRKKNHEKQLVINRRCWNKNKDRFNKERKDKYWSDPEFRAKKIQSDRNYMLSGIRKIMWDKNPNKKLRIRQRYERVTADPVRNQYRQKYRRQYRVSVQRPKEEGWRKELSDPYVVAVIKKQMKRQIKTKDIPKELIEIKRNVLKIKRTIRNKKP